MNPQQPGGPLPPLNPNQTPSSPSVPPPPYAAASPATPMQLLPSVPVDPAQAFPAPMPANDPNDPYQFIMSPGQSAKKRVPLAGGSKLTRIAIFGGGVVVLIILFAVLAPIIGGGGKSLQPIIDVAEEQTELMRVADQGAQYAVDSKVKNLAYNVKLSVQSDRNQTLAYLASNHKKVGTKILVLKHSKQTDTALANAQTASTFDSTFTTVIQNDLAAYSQDLKTAFQTNPGPKAKQLLNQQYGSAQLLLTQSKE